MISEPLLSLKFKARITKPYYKGGLKHCFPFYLFVLSCHSDSTKAAQREETTVSILLIFVADLILESVVSSFSKPVSLIWQMQVNGDLLKAGWKSIWVDEHNSWLSQCSSKVIDKCLFLEVVAGSYRQRYLFKRKKKKGTKKEKNVNGHGKKKKMLLC